MQENHDPGIVGMEKKLMDDRPKSMTALEYLISVHSFGAGGFWSVENPKKAASNSELRRWINQQSLHVNGEFVSVGEVLDYPLHTVVLFPKNQRRRITLL